MVKIEQRDALLAVLQGAQELETLSALILDFRDHFRVDHMAYHWASAGGEQYGFCTYSEAWVQRYNEEGYVRIDPVILGGFQRFHPVDWKELDWSSKVARDFMADGVAHGVGSQGVSVPIRGPNGQFALFTVNHTCSDDAWRRFTQENRHDLILIAHEFNGRALALHPDTAPNTVRPLSPREADAMTFLALGHSRAQVAEMLEISEHTLRAYIESARAKLGAQNTTHAVARALSRGLIVV